MATNEKLRAQGQIFHQLRKQRNYSIASLGEKSTISRFERGQGSLHLEDALDIFNKINLCPADFYGFLHPDQPSAIKTLAQEVFDAFTTLDLKKLLALQKKAEASDDALLALGLKILLTDPVISEQLEAKGLPVPVITTKEEYTISDYVFQIDYWDYYNLFLFDLFCMKLSDKMLEYCMNYFSRRVSEYHHNAEHSHILLLSLSRTVFYMLDKGDQERARDFLDKLSLFTTEDDLFYRVVQRYLEGYYDYSFVDKAAGRLKMAGALGVLRDFGSEKIVRILDYHFKTRCSDVDTAAGASSIA